jgi:hypothetical protein
MGISQARVQDREDELELEIIADFGDETAHRSCWQLSATCDGARLLGCGGGTSISNSHYQLGKSQSRSLD